MFKVGEAVIMKDYQQNLQNYLKKLAGLNLDTVECSNQIMAVNKTGFGMNKLAILSFWNELYKFCQKRGVKYLARSLPEAC